MSVKRITVFLWVFISLYNGVMAQAQKEMEGIYLVLLEDDPHEYELIRFKSNQTFTNFHRNKSGNELGKGLFSLWGDTLTMDFEDVETVTVFDRTNDFPANIKFMPSITFFDKKLGTAVGGVKIYVGEEDKATISDDAGTANLPRPLETGTILKIKAKGFYTQELEYDGFFRISYYLTNDTYYKTMDGPRKYKIINLTPELIELSFSFDFGLLSSQVENYSMTYHKITEEKAKELLGQQEYIKFMLE